MTNQTASDKTPKTLALITGANRGIGRAISEGLARQGHHVILAGRDAGKLEAVATDIRAAGGSVETLSLDVTNAASITAAAKHVAERHGKLDILVNNAGIMVGPMENVFETPRAEYDRALATNAFAALDVATAFRDLLRKAQSARIINVSSTAGSLSDIVDPTSPYGGVEAAAYRLSKLTLNGVTALLAKALRKDGILVNAMCPGWVKTDMGGESAPRTPAEGADTALWLAGQPANGPTGGFFRDRAPLAW
jgi:NAD(P)-dependent dehydrogenase (short-subunit alcohol dehydrogenase family)